MTAYPYWPHHTLPPEPFDSDYVFTPGDTRVRTAVEQGTPRQRRASDVTLDTIHLRWRFSPDQYEIFNGFIDTALAGGGGWFWIDVFIDADYVRLTARFKQGTFDRRQRSDATWEVSADLEVMDVPVMSSEDLTAAIGAPTPGAGLQPWPTDVLAPEPLNDSFAHVIADGVNRDDLAGGDIAQARPFRQRPAIYEWSIPVTNAECAILRGFLKWRAKNGTGWFSAPMMRGGSYETQAVRIVANTLRHARSGGDWIVSAQLEVTDLAPLSVEETTERILTDWSGGHGWADHGTELAGLVSDYAAAVA